jgi:hypothetical protein
MSSPDNGPEAMHYVGYDTKTGRIVHTHAQFNVMENRYVEVPSDELKASFAADPGIVAKLTDGDASNLDFIRVDGAAADGRLAPQMVDTASRRLVPRPRLVLSADKKEIAGDGQDSVDINVQVTGEDGQAVGGAAGAVKVTTTRGKLSARGGVVNLSDGHGTVTLTSANETVSQVRVTASALDQPYTSAILDLEFV